MSIWQPDKVQPKHGPTGALILEACEPQAGYVLAGQYVRWQGVDWQIQEVQRPSGGEALAVRMVVQPAPAGAAEPPAASFLARSAARMAGRVAVTAEMLQALTRIPEILRRLDDLERAVRDLGERTPKKPAIKPPHQA